MYEVIPGCCPPRESAIPGPTPEKVTPEALTCWTTTVFTPSLVGGWILSCGATTTSHAFLRQAESRSPSAAGGNAASVCVGEPLGDGSADCPPAPPHPATEATATNVPRARPYMYLLVS